MQVCQGLLGAQNRKLSRGNGSLVGIDAFGFFQEGQDIAFANLIPNLHIDGE